MTGHVRVPRTASKGEVMEIKTLISHPMETGYRRDDHGRLRPRHIIHTFTRTYNGEQVFRADWHPAVAANPYLAFTVATESVVCGSSGLTTPALCMQPRLKLPWYRLGQWAGRGAAASAPGVRAVGRAGHGCGVCRCGSAMRGRASPVQRRGATLRLYLPVAGEPAAPGRRVRQPGLLGRASRELWHHADGPPVRRVPRVMVRR